MKMAVMMMLSPAVGLRLMQNALLSRMEQKLDAQQAAFQGESILAATLGMTNCTVVPQIINNFNALAQRGCTVVTSNVNGQPVTRAGALPLGQGCPPLANGDGYDALPVTFSSPVVQFQASDFEFTLNNGSKVVANCANAAPANEGNEFNTILTAGIYSDGLACNVWPVSVEIVGNLMLQPPNGAAPVNALGMVFNDIAGDMNYCSTAAPHMVIAQVQSFSNNGEAQANNNQVFYPNDCGTVFGSSVTHKVQVVLSGGATTDGWNTALPTDRVFEVILNNGTVLSDDYVLGNADIGTSTTDGNSDLDNYFDICIADPDLAVVNNIQSIRMPCDQVQLYYPRGRSATSQVGSFVWSPCVDHSIDVRS